MTYNNGCEKFGIYLTAKNQPVSGILMELSLLRSGVTIKKDTFNLLENEFVIQILIVNTHGLASKKHRHY